MSNILKKQDDLMVLRDIINYVDKNNLSKSYLEAVLKLLIPNNNGDYLVSYDVKEEGMSTAIFMPQYMCIKASLNKIKKWLELNSRDLADFYKVNNDNTLKSFLFLFVITHEIEHTYQYLMGKGLIESPSKVIQYGYKEIFDLLLPNNYIIPRPIKQVRNKISLILYKTKQNFLILERNANVECADLLCQLSLYMEREELFKMFDHMKNSFISIGYKENCCGSLEETYKKILLYDRYKRFYEKVNINEDEKIRYGLNISEQTRQKVLKNNQI